MHCSVSLIERERENLCSSYHKVWMPSFRNFQIHSDSCWRVELFSIKAGKLNSQQHVNTGYIQMLNYVCLCSKWSCIHHVWKKKSSCSAVLHCHHCEASDSLFPVPIGKIQLLSFLVLWKFVDTVKIIHENLFNSWTFLQIVQIFTLTPGWSDKNLVEKGQKSRSL